jgi:hypothetical protein
MPNYRLLASPASGRQKTLGGVRAAVLSSSRALPALTAAAEAGVGPIMHQEP